MAKVITYGTFDLFHIGHLRLLQRAKALAGEGGTLIVAVSTDRFNWVEKHKKCAISDRDRMEIVGALKCVDMVIPEDAWEQKKTDVAKYGVDIFVMGDDWKGKFDYLSEYCEVVYLNRTQGISSSQIRAETGDIKFGIVGNVRHLEKLKKECGYINGINMHAICTENPELKRSFADCELITESFELLIKNSDAVYICSHPDEHYRQIKYALENGKHVLCEIPSVTSVEEAYELRKIVSAHPDLIYMAAENCCYWAFIETWKKMREKGEFGDVVFAEILLSSFSGIQSRGLIVQSQTDGIQQGAFAGTGIAANQEQACGSQRIILEIQFCIFQRCDVVNS